MAEFEKSKCVLCGGSNGVFMWNILTLLLVARGFLDKQAGEKAGEEDDMDLDVTQRELNEALGHTKDQDPQYVRFLTRVALAKDQVLRYSRWENEAVLWVHSEGMHTGDVPPCERCGGERKFEFQVLPQLLNYLCVDQQSSLGTFRHEVASGERSPSTRVQRAVHWRLNALRSSCITNPRTLAPPRRNCHTLRALINTSSIFLVSKSRCSDAQVT